MEQKKNFRKTFFRRELRRVALSRLALCITGLVLIVLLNTADTVSLISARLHGTADIDPSLLLTVTAPRTQLTEYPFSANLEQSDVFDEEPALQDLFLEVDGKIVLRFTPDEILDTGYVAVEQSGAESETVEYVYARIGDRLLIVKRPVLMPLDTLTGTVGYLPEDIETAILLASDTDPADVLPLFMDCTMDVYSSFTTEVLFSAALLLIWGLWLFFRLRELCNYERTDAYKQLFICSGPVEDNAAEIDRELQALPLASVGFFRTIETEHWSLHRRLFSFTLEHHDERH